MTMVFRDVQIQQKVLAVGASPRKDGNSDYLLRRFCAHVNDAGIATEEIQLRDHQFTPCVGCELCREAGQCSRFEDDMVDIYKKIIESRGLFLISPVHNYNITAWMKGFIDRLYCFYDFSLPRPGAWSSKLSNQGRKAVIAAVGEQPHKEDMGFTLEAMQMPLEALGYEVIETLPILGVFGRGQVKDDTGILRETENRARQLALSMKQDLKSSPQE